MRAITLALLVPAALAVWAGAATAQDRNPAFDLPDNTHFALNRTGGEIIVTAANPEDPADTNFIQTQLSRIAMTGLRELEPLGASVKYNFEATWDGGRIRIRAANPAALNAVHDLLRLKIAEMQTGDTGQVE